MILKAFKTGLVLCALSGFFVYGQTLAEKDMIQFSERGSYWSYRGVEMMLLGGSSEDNLFQNPDIVEELNLLKESGGNYVRCTMSSRDEGNVWPFAKNKEGLYDLNTFNDEYWKRFENLLRATSERNIIVQIELWATFDFYRENWDVNPFNPKNNINYDAEWVKLPVKVDSHPTGTKNNFFRTVPSQMAISSVLSAQQRYVDKLLSISLNHGNVLYCMDNETSVTSDWGKFWAAYILEQASEAGLAVHTTEMWDPWDLNHPFHAETYNNPQYFTFMDISQNNHNSGDIHWENGLKTIRKIHAKGVRPINNVKVYGNDGGRHKSTRDGIENYIQNVFMGCASTRFHRPTSGQGINETAQAVIQSMRWVVDRTDFFNAYPMNELLIDRVEDQQYCRAIPGLEYVVAFMKEGSCKLDIQENQGKYSIKWLNILNEKWYSEETVAAKDLLLLETPGDGYWLVFVELTSR
jgi:hypothetical protein